MSTVWRHHRDHRDRIQFNAEDFEEIADVPEDRQQDVVTNTWQSIVVFGDRHIGRDLSQRPSLLVLIALCNTRNDCYVVLGSYEK